jgi:hypothetical protein
MEWPKANRVKRGAPHTLRTPEGALSNPATEGAFHLGVQPHLL